MHGGLPDVDRFASALTAKLPLYNSIVKSPESRKDAKMMNWGGLFNYVNPPFNMLTQIVQKILKDREAPSTIAVWPSQPWWPLLLPMLMFCPWEFWQFKKRGSLYFRNRSRSRRFFGTERKISHSASASLLRTALRLLASSLWFSSSFAYHCHVQRYAGFHSATSVTLFPISRILAFLFVATFFSKC